jgi:hypothetical protein
MSPPLELTIDSLYGIVFNSKPPEVSVLSSFDANFPQKAYIYSNIVTQEDDQWIHESLSDDSYEDTMGL